MYWAIRPALCSWSMCTTALALVLQMLCRKTVGIATHRPICVENSAWEGTPEDLARTLSIYSTSILPAEMAMLLIGLPVIDDAAYTATASGLQTASTGDVFVTFAPPQFPARNVTVRRGNDVVVIEHLEVVSSQ